MNPELDKIDKLVEVARHILSKTEKPLDDKEEAILKHILAGRSLKTAKVGGYASSTIQRDIAPALWKRLDEGVTVKTVKLFLEKALTILSVPSLIQDNNLARLATEPYLEFPVVINTSSSDPQNSYPLDRQTPNLHTPLKRIPHNLPKQTCSQFIGRQAPIAKIIKLLSPEHTTYEIGITGLGGVGKTSLAIHCARQCLHASCTPDGDHQIPTFDIVIYASAQQQYLDHRGIRDRRDPYHKKSIIQQIIEMLDTNKLLEGEQPALDFDEQVALIYKVLSNQQTLLIIDNLEIVENKQDIEDFICDLPSSVKTIITSRERTIGTEIRLPPLSEQEGLSLVQYQAGEHGVSLRSEESKELYQLTGGLPIAINYAIGQLKHDYSVEEVSLRLCHPTGNIAQYCFEKSVRSLQQGPAYWLLLAIVLFPKPASRKALIDVAIPDLDSHTAEDAMVQLQTLSLISQERNTPDKLTRYSIISLTREYTSSELKAHPQFEQDARQRWVNWYLDFSKAYAQQDPAAWQGEFDELDEEWHNLQSVAEWCMKNDHYGDMVQLLKNLKPYIYMVGRRNNCLRYWNAGFAWTKWLIDAASQRADWRTAGETMAFRAWLLVGIGTQKSLEEEQNLLEQAWILREHQADLKAVSNLARQLGWLNIRQADFDQAREWLITSEKIIYQAELDDRKRAECLSQTRYYQGISHLQAQEAEDAKHYFEDAYRYAQSTGLDRLVQVIENSLADVMILQGETESAQNLLDKGLRIAIANSDQSRIASNKRSLAKLAQRQGNLAEANGYAKEAINSFEQLGMIVDANEIRAFIASELNQ